MQQRVPRPAGPVVEPDRQQSPSVHVLVAAVVTAGPQVVVQVADRLTDTSVVGAQHRPAGRRVAQAVQDRHALGGAQDHSKAGTALRPWARPRSSPVSGWRPSNMRWKPAGDASPCSPKLAAPAPYQRPGLSPSPDRYCSWSVASSRV
jgi:hypothetical protein